MTDRSKLDKFLFPEIPKMIIEVPTTNNALFADMTQFKASFEKVIQPLQQINDMFDYQKPIFDYIEKQLKQNPIINDTKYLSNLTSVAQRAIKEQQNWDNLFNKIEAKKNKFIVLLAKFGYPPNFGDLTFPEMDEIMDFIDINSNAPYAKIKDEIDRHMIKRYRNEVNNILNKWKKMKSIYDIMPILNNIVDAHNQGFYWCTVPTCMSALEGAVARATNHTGFMGGPQLVKNLEKILPQFDNDTDEEQIYKFYRKELLSTFTHGGNIKSFLSRNAILHGGDISYGTELNSIKMILFCELIFDKINDYLNKP